MGDRSITDTVNKKLEAKTFLQRKCHSPQMPLSLYMIIFQGEKKILERG